MKSRPFTRAIAAIVLLLTGATCAFLPLRRYDERRIKAVAGTCSLDLEIIQKRGVSNSPESGAVLLFHGLAANKVIMAYLARSFAELGLTVYVPDLPGHGRTPGPFTPDSAEACAMSLTRGLAARGLIVPDRTIVAGHSMGGAIALLVAERFRPAAVIALSPAPFVAAHGVTSERLLYSNPPAIRPHTLIMAGQWEPPGLAPNAADLAASAKDPSVQFESLAGQSHVSVLFSPQAARLSQDWAAKALNLPNPGILPTQLPALGCLLGLAGLLLIAGPFLKEMCGKAEPLAEASTPRPSSWRLLLEVTLASVAIVVALHFFIPLKFIGLFEGDYLASFFLLLGLVLLALHPKLARHEFQSRPAKFLGVAAGALMLHLLITGWFELTFSGAWLSLDKWTHFPLFFLSCFVFFYALEALLGPVGQRDRRLTLDLLALLFAWLVMVLAVFVLHSGQLLIVLLLPYFALFFLFLRPGARLVRLRTGSATAAALFGAILLAGFSLVLFPVS